MENDGRWVTDDKIRNETAIRMLPIIVIVSIVALSISTVFFEYFMVKFQATMPPIRILGMKLFYYISICVYSVILYATYVKLSRKRDMMKNEKNDG